MHLFGSTCYVQFYENYIENNILICCLIEQDTFLVNLSISTDYSNQMKKNSAAQQK